MSTVYHGICRQGPKNGKVHAQRDSKRYDQPDGFYVWRPASGPTPAEWRWIDKKDGTK